MRFSIFSSSRIFLYFVIAVVVILIARNSLKVVDQDISVQKEEMTRRINQGPAWKTGLVLFYQCFSYFPTARGGGDCPSYENLCF